MRPYTFTSEFWLPVERRRVFAFFADPHNLEAITPPWLRFEILTPDPIPLEVGTTIDYRLRLRGIPLRWRSEITVWEPLHRFVDEQRRGPYRFWRHTHSFSDLHGGTICRDEVEYAVPGGAIVHTLLVRGDLRRIFAYRATAMRRHFPPAG